MEMKIIQRTPLPVKSITHCQKPGFAPLGVARKLVHVLVDQYSGTYENLERFSRLLAPIYDGPWKLQAAPHLLDNHGVYLSPTFQTNIFSETFISF